MQVQRKDYLERQLEFDYKSDKTQNIRVKIALIFGKGVSFLSPLFLKKKMFFNGSVR